MKNEEPESSDIKEQKFNNEESGTMNMKKLNEVNEESGIMNTQKLKVAFALNLIVVVLEVYATANSLTHFKMNMFQYYTIDSNIIAIFSSLFYVCFYKKQKPLALAIFRLLAAVNLSLTFLIVLFVLSPSMGGIYVVMFQGNSLFQHFFCPIITVISFFFFEKDITTVKGMWRLLPLPTAVYAAIMIFLNISYVIEGPYPFLHVYEQPIWISFLWVIVILSLISFLSWGFETLKRRLG